MQPGGRISRFEILGPVGAGGMGEVYRARDTRLGRDVAIKVEPLRGRQRSGSPRAKSRGKRGIQC